MVNVAKVVALCDAREMKERRERERGKVKEKGKVKGGRGQGKRERRGGEGKRGRRGEEKREERRYMGKKWTMLLARKSIFLHPHWACSINM